MGLIKVTEFIRDTTEISREAVGSQGPLMTIKVTEISQRKKAYSILCCTPEKFNLSMFYIGKV